MIRGGGSSSDLNCFNAYRLCNHVAQFPLPVVTGIGHDKDTSVADLVAHTALKTPTAVAAWLVERMAQADGLSGVGRIAVRKCGAGDHAFGGGRTGTARRGSRTAEPAVVAGGRSRLDRAEETLLAAPADLLRGHDRRLAAASELLLSYSVEQVLRRGFAVVRRGGEALRSAEGLSPGDRLDITLADGEVQAAVVACTKKKR